MCYLYSDFLKCNCIYECIAIYEFDYKNFDFIPLTITYIKNHHHFTMYLAITTQHLDPYFESYEGVVFNISRSEFGVFRRITTPDSSVLLL